MNIQLSFTDEVKTNTSQIYNRIKDTVPDVEWPLLAPYIYEINKLKKDNLLDPSEMLGQKLTSEKALDLYKNNIRIHPKHYVPKDLKKYFHSHEIEGGALNLNKAFKKLGSKVKHTFENIGNKVIYL